MYAVFAAGNRVGSLCYAHAVLSGDSMVCGSDVIGSVCENQVILGDNTVTCRSGNGQGSLAV